MDKSQAQPNDAEQSLRQAVQKAREVLVTASTLSIPKNTLTLSRAKLVAEKRSGIQGVDVMSVRIEDVLNVNGSVGPLVGSINIATKFTKPGEPLIIGPFRRKDTIRLKRIIQGYIIALQDKIDVNAIPTDELIKLLYGLGDDDRAIQ